VTRRRTHCRRKEIAPADFFGFRELTIFAATPPNTEHDQRFMMLQAATRPSPALISYQANIRHCSSARDGNLKQFLA